MAYHTNRVSLSVTTSKYREIAKTNILQVLHSRTGSTARARSGLILSCINLSNNLHGRLFGLLGSLQKSSGPRCVKGRHLADVKAVFEVSVAYTDHECVGI